jgi:hypothetical protein
MHINLDPDEIDEMESMRGRLIKGLKVTTEWETLLAPNEKTRKRELYIEKFGDPFNPMGGNGLAELVNHYMEFVEKDTAALGKLVAS